MEPQFSDFHRRTATATLNGKGIPVRCARVWSQVTWYVNDERGIRVALVVTAWLLTGGDAGGQALSDLDNTPFATIYGLPDSSDGAFLLKDGEAAWGASFLIASHSVADASPGELLIIDGETARAAIKYRRGLGSRWEMGIELPYVSHQSGGLDSVIDEWHSAFGLPDGARDDRPRDLIEFRYLDLNGPVVDFRRNAHGVGDLRLLGAYEIWQTSQSRMALRFGVKLPTGDSDDWLGSGATDVSIGVVGDHQALWQSERWSGFYRAYATFLGEPDQLADRYEEWVWQLSGGLTYRLSDRVALDVQGLLRSALYDVEVAAIGEPAVLLTFGARVQLSDRWELVLGVGEDVKVESVPDVTFQLGLRLNR